MSVSIEPVRLTARVDTRLDLTWKPWAEKICAAWQKTTASIIETGQLLVEAQSQLPHGSWETMVRERLPFSPRAAQMLMEVARHPVIANPKHVSLLPAHWSTLYQITRDAASDYAATKHSGG